MASCCKRMANGCSNVSSQPPILRISPQSSMKMACAVVESPLVLAEDPPPTRYLSVRYFCSRSQGNEQRYILQGIEPSIALKTVVMAASQEPMIQRWWLRVGRAWKSLQVELQGQYSIERLYRMKKYSQRTGVARTMLVLSLTPLPCLATVLVIECIPLNDPELGVEHALPFLVRAFLITQIVDFLVLHQLRHLIPTLPTSNTLMFAAACIAASGAVAVVYGMAKVIGFPLPFTMLWGSPVSSALLGACAFAMWGPFFRTNAAERKDLLNYFVVVAVQVTMTYVYPAFAFVFVRLSSGQQIILSMLLPFIKLFVKNWFSYLFRDKHDLKSDMVVLNADIYHSLFVSWCMNGTTSTLSTAFLMLMDSAEALLALRDVDNMLNKLSPILNRVGDSNLSTQIKRKNWFGGDKYDGAPILDVAMAIWEIDRFKANMSVRKVSHVRPPTKWHPSSISAISSSRAKTNPASSHISSLKGPSLAPLSIATAPSKITGIMPGAGSFQPEHRLMVVDRAKQVVTAMSESERARCLQLVLQLLHLAEFLLLIEFVEVVIPAVYCASFTLTFSMPSFN